ncbi:MAG: GNAT family N-acetyltransferase [Bradyrhizobium sp.]|uniref:GNAT family N-acetyltransferase n=1 Tax=Bradyrhizobium sp. TaxID=376 RepID=UPI001D44C3D8|nr:GNAT family N-acetyltransferase [Bradyrhizobium sp.]MBV9563523.1 GNAT family N-acetyltransferase [Bradyrhizobium sp.]
MTLIVQWRAFADLTPSDLYDALRLRQAVFVVEQACAFLDADGFDRDAIHGVGRDASGELVAVVRVLPPGCRHPIPSISRLAVAKHTRSLGYGRATMAAALLEAQRRYPQSPVHLDAQAHLARFYASFGFVPVGEPFDDDGIPHIAMRWAPR